MQYKTGLTQTWILALLLSVTPIVAISATHGLDEMPNAAVTTTHNSADAAIRGLMANFILRWHDSDARGLSVFFVPDGDFINPDGSWMKGRKQIEEFYAQAFSMGYAGSTATASVDQIQFLKPDIAVMDGKFGISDAITRDHHALPPEKGRYTAILKESAGRWWIVSNREMEPPNRH